MSTLLFGALWVHLASCVFITGGFFLLLLAGPPPTAAMRRWEQWVLSAARWLVLLALVSGVAWLAARTAAFEGRQEAALEPKAILRGMLNTWPGLVWMLRCGLLIILAAFLFMDGESSNRTDWIAARSEAFLLSALALVLLGISSHSAAISESLWARSIDMTHLFGAGIWVGSLPPLALLLYAASRNPAAPDPYAVLAMQRFSRVALTTVLVLAASGIAIAWLLVEGVAGLVGTTHGHLLLAKLAALIPALLLAAASRVMLRKLSSRNEANRSATVRQMALFIGAEAGLVLIVLGCAAAMTVTTPARHSEPVWPCKYRLSLDRLADLSFIQQLKQPPLWLALAGFGLALLAAALIARRRSGPLILGPLFALIAGGALIGLPPLVVEAYPTSYARPPVTYHAGSIAQGLAIYRTHCASCHHMRQDGREVPSGGAVDLNSPTTTRRSAGDLFWLATHGRPERGMPGFESQLADAERWHVINFLRAFSTSSDPRRIGTEVELDNAWLVAPDFTVSVGPLTPTTLRDLRGKRMVLLVLYALPDSRERMTELARRYGVLSVLGVEVIAVSGRSTSEAIADLGASPPVLFPVVTDGNEDIAATYRLFAPGSAHAEFLIDRQGYIRAIWRSDSTGMPDAAAVQAQVERLNEEKAPPPLPDDHIH